MLSLILVSETLALMVAIFYYPRYKLTIFKWLLPFLLFILTVELIGTALREFFKLGNSSVYSLSIPVEFSFYTFLFFHFLQSVWSRRVLLLLWVAMLVYDIITNILHFPDIFDFKILLLGNILMLISCSLYFWELFALENEMSLLEIPFFWISAGVFLFNLGEISYTLLGNELISKYDTFSNFLKYFETILCVILYSMIIIAILKASKPIAKSE